MALVTRLRAELAGRGQGWTDLSADLAEDPIRLRYGINGTGPVDRVASTGVLHWSFVNHARTSPARLLGRFSPNHANKLTGWKLGIGIQLILSPEGSFRSIVSSSVAAQTVITMMTAHGYSTGDRVVISGHAGSTATPAINGTHTIEVLTATTFRLLGVNCSVAGTGGTVQRRNLFFKFNGTLEDINVSPGLYSGDLLVRCTAVDWMNDAARQKVNGLATQTDVSSDDAFRALIAAAPVQPASLEVQGGQDIYKYAFDNSRDEKITLMSEFQRLTASELGFIYVKGDRQQGGTLTFETRRTRAVSTTNIDSFVDATTTGRGLQSIDIQHSRSGLVNSIQMTTHPRRVDPPASTTVLARLENPTPIGANSTLTLLFPYRDPTQEAARVGGLDMITPLAGTDYAGNTASDGSGSALSLSVVANFGGNGVRFQVTNHSLSNGFVTLLQARGRGIYDFQNVVLEAKDATSIANNGEQSTAIDMPYQSDPAVAAEASLYLVNVYKDPTSHVRSATLFAPYTDAAHIDRILRREISDRIGITEQVSGLAPGARGVGYFINAVDLTIDARNNLSVSWTLAPADRTAYWQLEVPTRSELDQTTVLGYGQIIGHTDIAHCDVHEDSAHADVLHADVAHSDTGHADAGHADVAHSDVAHSDSLHSDTAHADVAHSDVGHEDAHGDFPHGDEAHEDFAHGDWPHGDEAHDDAHGDDAHGDEAHEDEPHFDGHGDEHQDGLHLDEGPLEHEDWHADEHYDSHSDVAHSDASHGDGHDDGDHADNPHDDVEHGDAHTDNAFFDAYQDEAHGDTTHSDIGHSDVAHGDAHSDVAHSDGVHADSAHADVTHSDTSHSDVTHSDTHCDVLHGDI